MTRHLLRWSLPLALAAVLGVGAAMAATSLARGSATVKLAQNGKYGAILVSSSGRTLYRYTPDKKGKSNCSGTCAQTWPALTVKKGTKPTASGGAKASMLGTIKRGKALQVTYGGYPLYWYSGDSKSGAVNGEGVDGTWYAVSASGALVKREVSKGSGSTTTTTTGTTTTKTGWG
jgi:predicted lipoprotein with Yx(FWY)xxD motif